MTYRFGFGLSVIPNLIRDLILGSEDFGFKSPLCLSRPNGVGGVPCFSPEASARKE